MIINIRGTNGSGKTFLTRQFITPEAQPVALVEYQTPKGQPRFVDGWGKSGGFIAVGSYKQGCGGMDTISSFALQQEAVEAAANWTRSGGTLDKHPLAGQPPKVVICEGVLASTVYGSWADCFLALKAQGHRILVAYLDTPLDVCLDRIRQRQIAKTGEERAVKVDQIAAKVKAIKATQPRFDAAGIKTITLDWRNAQVELFRAINKELGA